VGLGICDGRTGWVYSTWEADLLRMPLLVIDKVSVWLAPSTRGVVQMKGDWMTSRAQASEWGMMWGLDRSSVLLVYGLGVQEVDIRWVR
jgi:hypothetical protein